MTGEEKAAILKDARATLERLAVEQLPLSEPHEDAFERWERLKPKPEEPKPPRDLDTPIDWDARIAAAIAAEREFMVEVIGAALGEYADQLVDEIEKKIAEQVDQLRAEIAEEVTKVRADMNPKREGDDGEVLLLPNPLQRRGGRG
jgi:hypothetical protein